MPGGFRLHISDTLQQDIKGQAGPEMRKAARAAAEKIAEDARSSAPVLTGKYRDSFKVSTQRDSRGRFSRGAVVSNDDPIAHIIEFGAPGRNLPARWILRQAGDRSGLEWVKGR